MNQITIQFSDAPQGLHRCIDEGVRELIEAYETATKQTEAARIAYQEARAAWDKSSDSELLSKRNAAGVEYSKAANRRSALERCLPFMNAVSSQLRMMYSD